MRDEFPILDAHRLHDQQLARRDAAQTARNLAEYADTWATRGVRAWEERWWEMPVEIGNKIARDHRRAARHR